MPTEPLKSILDRDLSLAEANSVIERVSPKLRESINYGTNLLARCSKWDSESIEDMAVPLLFIHILEVTDATEVLISNSCSWPTAALLRSSFEASLAIDYILQGEYEFRALVWLADFYRERINLYESLDPDTDRGRNLQEIINSDRWSGGTLTLKDDANYKKWSDNYREQLKSEKFKAVQERFTQLKKKLKRKPKWYQLTQDGNQGPGNIRELAETLKMLGFYEVLYRGWSTTLHAREPARFLMSTDDMAQTYRPLRDPYQLATNAQFALHFIVFTMKLIVGKFRPEEDLNFQQWYATEILSMQ